tara:strand:- start:15929 stop:16123 length:195 start_codon:yes stop_codon:yes gene_type:complete
MSTSPLSATTISRDEKIALEKILNRNERRKPKSSSMLGVCSATDDWRERHNKKKKVVIVRKSRN